MGAISDSLPDLWLKADAITSLVDGDPVGTWNDSSGNGYNATQATSGAKPTYKTGILTASGKPVVRFDGGDYLVSSAPSGATSQTVVALARPTSFTGDPTLRGSTASGGFQFRYQNTGKLQSVKQSIVGIGVSTTASSTSVFEVVAGRFADVYLYDATASSVWTTGFEAPNAVDGVTSNIWLAAAVASVGSPQWLRLKPRTSTVATSVKIYSRTTRAQYQAKDFTIQGSNDGSSWTTLDTRTGVSWADAETKTFSFSNSTAYVYYRIHCTATQGSGGSDFLEIAEIALNSDVTPTTNPTYSFRRNGVADGSATVGGVLPFATTTTQVGRNGSNSEFLNGDIAVLLSWSRALGDTELDAVMAELTATYLSSTTTGTVAATAPAPTVAVSGNVATVGTVIAAAPAPTVAVAGNVIVTGTVAATAPAPSVAIAGTVSDVTSGVVTATAPAPTVSITGDVFELVTGTVSATAPAPTVSVDGTALETITGTMSATAPAPTVHIVDTLGDPALLGIRLGIETTDQAVTFETETVDGLGVRLGVETSDVVIHAVETVNLGIGLGVRTYAPKAWGEDVRTGRPAPRIDIADRDGTLVATLPESTLRPLTTGVNVLDKFGFTVDRNSVRARLIEPVAHDAYLYRGNVLMAKGPIGPGRTDDDRTSYDCADPRWHLSDGRRRIGRIPKRQLLLNPGFTDGSNGLAHWVGGWDAGSALAAAPEAEVVDESYARSGKALQLSGVDKIMRGTETLETAAVFKGNRPYAWEPLANGFLPGGAAAITAIANMMTGPAPVVHITGHTADADSGDGQALSERRALAAKAVVLARWPAAVITTEGKGETQPAVKGHTEAAYKKNRRVVFDFERNISAVGHRQFYRQWVTVTQPTSAKVPLPLTFAADMRILEWLGAPGDGWAILIRAKRGSTVVDEAYATMDEFTPRVRWAHYEATVEIPADGIATSVDVHLYPPAGSSLWANAGLWPQDQLGFFDVDQALIVKGIVEHVQDTSLGHGDLGIGTRTPLTGVPRTREYPYHERMPADTALEWFTSVDSGLDISYDPDRNEVVTHYPRQGTSTDLALVHGGRRSNVVAYKPLSTSALALASNVIMQADGSGAARPEGYARDAAALGGTLVEAVISAEEETPLSELDEGAASALAASLRARPGWEVTVSPDWTTRVLDATGNGDTLRLVLPDEDVDGAHRLVSSEWDPETDIVTLTLIEEA